MVEIVVFVAVGAILDQVEGAVWYGMGESLKGKASVVTWWVKIYMTYSKNPTGGRTPISFLGSTALSADEERTCCAGAKAVAEAKRAERTAQVFMLV